MFEYHGVTFSAEDILEYLRKSRSDDPLLSVEEVLERHENILDEWAERHLDGKAPETNIFREVVSGETIKSRPEFQKILRLMESPKYKAVYVVEVQRLSRGDLEDAGRLIKLLRYTNTFVITPQKAYDLNDEYDRDFFERELKRGNEYLEYVKKIMLRGRLESVRSGNFIGSSTPYGYDRDWIVEGKKKSPTLKINDDEATVVKMIYDMYVHQNLGVYAIAHRLSDMGIKPRKNDIWSPSTIRDILDNDHYIGKVRWDRRKGLTTVEDGIIKQMNPRRTAGNYYVFDGKHPPIISEDLLKAARKRKGLTARTKNNFEQRNALAGLIYCECGYAMTYRAYKDSNGNMKCAPRLLCNNQRYCQNTSATYYEILDKVVDVLKTTINDFEVKLENSNEENQILQAGLIKTLESNLEELNCKEIRQWEQYTSGVMPQYVFKKLNEKLIEDRERMEHSLETAKKNVEIKQNYSKKVVLLKEALSALIDPKVPVERKNILLKSCIERIDYHREKGNRFQQHPYELNVKLKL